MVHRDNSIFDFVKDRLGDDFPRNQILFFLIWATCDDFLCIRIFDSGQRSELLDGSGVGIDWFDSRWRRSRDSIRSNWCFTSFRCPTGIRKYPKESDSHKKSQALERNHLAFTLQAYPLAGVESDGVS